MRKFGLIAAILGVGTLAVGLLLRLVARVDTWFWLPGIVLLCGGLALLLWSRVAASAAARPAPKIPQPIGTETARLLDNFEQRFAELKCRKPNATVLSDLYTLGNQLEQRGRAPQATAVYRHLARFDNTYRDVAARLRRLMDAERAKPKPAAAPAAAAPATTAPAAGGSPGTALPRRRGRADSQRLGRYQLEREIGRGAMKSSTWGAIRPLTAWLRSRPFRSPVNSSRGRTRGSPIAFLSRGRNRRPAQPSEHRHHL
jgi:serine/threonine-protein kinase